MLPLKFLIADDHPLIRAGLRYHLHNLFPSLKVIETTNGIQTLTALSESNFDLAFIDINMPVLNGLVVIDKFNQLKTGFDTKLAILTIYKDYDYYSSAKELGVKGYLLKEYALEEIETCVNELMEGNIYISPVVKEEFENIKKTSAIRSFSDEELKVISMMAQAKTPAEISKTLLLSKKKIENVKKQICTKVSIPQDDYALLSWAFENKDYFSTLL